MRSDSGAHLASEQSDPELALAEKLTGLGSSIDREEAKALSRIAIGFPKKLRSEYGVFACPIVHNVLVNMRLRKRGLCYHWTLDLLKEIDNLKLESFEFHWATAYPGSVLREHNSPVVTEKGMDFANGLILDAWRYSGDLYWIEVSKDHYPWVNTYLWPR